MDFCHSNLWFSVFTSLSNSRDSSLACKLTPLKDLRGAVDFLVCSLFYFLEYSGNFPTSYMVDKSNYVFFILFKKSLPDRKSISPILFSRSFIIWGLQVGLWLILSLFLCMIGGKIWDSFYYLYVASLYFQHYLLKRWSLSPLNCQLALCMWFYFWFCYSGPFTFIFFFFLLRFNF